MTYLVITADDLGIDPRRDDGILAAFAEGAITQASLLVAGRSARAAAERARREGISIGLHLDLTETPPCAPPSAVASLLNAHGVKLGKHGLRAAVERGAIALAHVARETEAQIEAFVALMGEPPSHVDGHQHVHVVPQLTETLAAAFAQAGVVTTRIPDQRFASADNFYARVSAQAAAARAVYARHGIASTDGFVGHDSMGDASDAAKLRAAFEASPHAGSIEVMTHPGYTGTGWDDFNESSAREHELRVLLEYPFRNLVEAGRATLATFHELGRRR